MTLCAFSIAEAQEKQETFSNFQHQGLTQSALDQACSELKEECDDNTKATTSFHEKAANYTLQAAFGILVPGTIMKIILSTDSQQTAKDLWSFKSINDGTYVDSVVHNKEQKTASAAINLLKSGLNADGQKIDKYSKEYGRALRSQVKIDPQAARDYLDRYTVNAHFSKEFAKFKERTGGGNKEFIEYKAKQAEKNQKNVAKGEKLKKVCNMITIAGVAGAWFNQKVVTKKVKATRTQNDQETSQSELLYGIADLHHGKAKDAKILTGVFGATGACYAAAFTMKLPVFDLEALGKAGLSLFVASGYARAISDHNNIKETALKYADAIPEKGACTPGSSCFCLRYAELSQKHHPIEYKQYCTETTYTAANYCIDKYGIYDEDCNCKNSNSCLGSTVGKILKKFNVNPELQSEVTSATASFSNGEVGELSESSASQSLQYSQSIVAKLSEKSSLPENLKLSKDEIKLAKDYKEAGLDPKVALLASQLKASEKDKKAMPNNPFTLDSYKLTKRSRGKASKGSDKKNDAMDFLALFGKKKNDEPTGGVEFSLDSARMTASRQAVIERASIHDENAEPIFNIISTRYLQTALWEEEKK